MRTYTTILILLLLSFEVIGVTQSVNGPLLDKCGVYNVHGLVEVEKKDSLIQLFKGSMKQVSLKITNPPHSLKMLDGFTVDLKLRVKKVANQVVEAIWIRSDDEITVLPGSNDSSAQLVSEEKCTQ